MGCFFSFLSQRTHHFKGILIGKVPSEAVNSETIKPNRNSATDLLSTKQKCKTQQLVENSDWYTYRHFLVLYKLPKFYSVVKVDGDRHSHKEGAMINQD